MSVPNPSLFQIYCEALRRHALELIARGYRRMDKAAFAQQEEPAITGELVSQMCAFLETEPGAPNWVTHYSIHDDPPSTRVAGLAPPDGVSTSNSKESPAADGRG